MVRNQPLCLATLLAAATPAFAQQLMVPYDNVSNVMANGTGGNFLGNCENVIEDCRFSPGPWAGARNRLITETTFGIAVLTTATTDEQVLLIFWRLSDLNFEGWAGAGTGMLNPAATPLAVARVQIPPLAPNFIYLRTAELQGLAGGGVAIPDGDQGVAVQIAWVAHGCVPASYQDLSACLLSGCASTSTRGIAFGNDSLQPDNPPSVGSTLFDYGRDISNTVMCPNNGRFIGNGGPPVNTGNIEHRFIFVTPQGGSPIREAAELRFRGAAIHCGSADFDHDGNGATDADIEAFFACLAGNCCATCESADFDGDGDVATDADIEAFFFVLAGGSC
jgi:hypothetical protein